MRKILFVVNKTKQKAQEIAERLSNIALKAGMEMRQCGR